MTAPNERKMHEDRTLHAEFASGSVQLTYNVHWDRLSPEDREFLNGLIATVSKLGGAR